MDLELSDDQRASVDLTRAMAARRFDLARVRRRENADVVVDADDWRVLGESGVFSLAIAEEAGGAGLGLADAALVFCELGRALVPGPLVATHLAARLAAGVAGSPAASLSGAADGATVVSLVRRPPTGDGPVLVEHRASLGALLVAEPDGALSLVEASELAPGTPAVPLDPLTPVSLVDTLPRGVPLCGAQDPAWVRELRVLSAAYCVGIAAATCDLAVAYAKERRQFGRPIGSFQAVKHLCADMAVRAELARAAADAAAVTADQPDTGDPERAAASAALVGAEAAVANAKSCIQVHGGMGFTWDVPVHLFLMRARVVAASLGPADALAREVAARW